MHRLAALLLLATAACAPDPVEWTPQGTAAWRGDSAVVLRADGTLASDSLAAVEGRAAPALGAVCPGSLRLARAGRALHAVWWAVRPDSGARLLAARSLDDGRTWSAAASVDTTDRAVSGCRREPPAIAADPTTGYVHVTYALLAPEGPGIFFSHSMDDGASFHSPVPILYGERLGRASVAADGDRVVVAFEDPNSSTPRIGLAISHTMGHIFEDRLVPVSDDNGLASRPLTAVRGRHIAVAWEQRATDGATPALAVRAGTLR